MSKEYQAPSGAERPITPPPELVQCFLRSNPDTPDGMTYEQFIATRFARWGADTELEACVKYFHEYDSSWGENSELITGLRAARRPKPPSFKEQALKMLADVERCTEGDFFIIRRALESLDD